MRVLNFSLVVAASLVGLVVWSHLPAVVPVHWNAQGVADGYGPRGVASFMLPAVMLVLFGLFAALPRLSPSGYRLEPMRGAYHGIVCCVLLFLFGVHAVILVAGLGYAVPIARVVPTLVALLFAALGPFIGRATPNFFAGIRTPWTLTDSENWRATHRFAARLFVVGGLLLAGLAAAGVAFWVPLAGFLALGLLPVAYSLGRHLLG